VGGVGFLQPTAKISARASVAVIPKSKRETHWEFWREPFEPPLTRQAALLASPPLSSSSALL